ncbi:MAG: ABC transporter permease [Oscillospiraceae bacterium]
MKHLTLYNIKTSYKIFFGFFAVLIMYIAVIISIFDPTMASALDKFTEAMPGIMSAFGMANSSKTMLDFLGNYLYGFLLTVLPSAFIIIISGRLLAKYVDNNSAVYLLTNGKSRFSIALNQGLFLGACVILLMALITATELIIIHIMFPGTLNSFDLIGLNLHLLGLHIFVAGFCFMISCCVNSSKSYYGLSIGVLALFFVIDMLSKVSDKLSFLKSLTIFTLFNPQKIISNQPETEAMAVFLFSAGIALAICGINHFRNRDLHI